MIFFHKAKPENFNIKVKPVRKVFPKLSRFKTSEEQTINIPTIK